MRSNSGSGDSNNNLHDPTLRDAERARGKSGEAVLVDDDGKGESRSSPESGPARKN